VRRQLLVPITLPLGKEPLLSSKQENELVTGPVWMWWWKDTCHTWMKSRLSNVSYVILLAEYPVRNQYAWCFKKNNTSFLCQRKYMPLCNLVPVSSKFHTMVIKADSLWGIMNVKYWL